MTSDLKNKMQQDSFMLQQFQRFLTIPRLNKQRIALGNGLKEFFGIMKDLSGKIVKRESVKPLGTTPLNSLTQSQTSVKPLGTTPLNSLTRGQTCVKPLGTTPLNSLTQGQTRQHPCIVSYTAREKRSQRS